MKKGFWLSKTFWTNLILALLAGLYPPAHVWISGHVTEVALVWSGINMLLRLISKDKIKILP